MIDNAELSELMDILENMQDEELAAELLHELNASTSALGKLIMNTDKSLPHEVWKEDCDKARAVVDGVIKRIRDNQ